VSGVEGTPSGPLLPPLAAAFPATSREDWEAAVETALKGRSFDSLLSSTDGGVELQPLYIPAETPTGHDESGFPGSAPATRGATAVPRPGGRWDVRRPIDEPDAFAGNRAALRDLERGVTSLEVPFPPASADDLAGRLDGVLLDLAPVVLRPGWDFESAAEALEALWSAQGLALRRPSAGSAPTPSARWPHGARGRARSARRSPLRRRWRPVPSRPGRRCGR
jgi:methylmalonyl-CoA mutase